MQETEGMSLIEHRVFESAKLAAELSREHGFPITISSEGRMGDGGTLTLFCPGASVEGPLHLNADLFIHEINRLAQRLAEARKAAMPPTAAVPAPGESRDWTQKP